MSLTLSTMLELGSRAEPFSLPNFNTVIDKQAVSWSPQMAVSTDSSKGLLVAFICNHCPYVVHIAEQLSNVLNMAQQNGLDVVAINANDVQNYAADSPEKMTEFAVQYGFEFPYLFDQDQGVAKAYTAACTPDFFLFDATATLVYRGQFDASRPGNSVAVTGEDLMQAVDHLLDGKAIVSEQIPSVGCNIKWLAGNSPSYFGS